MMFIWAGMLLFAKGKNDTLFYSVQVAAEKGHETDTVALKEKYHLIQPLRISFQDGYYKYSVGRFVTMKEAVHCQNRIRNVNGLHGAFVISFNGKKSESLRKYDKKSKEIKQSLKERPATPKKVKPATPAKTTEYPIQREDKIKNTPFFTYFRLGWRNLLHQYQTESFFDQVVTYVLLLLCVNFIIAMVIILWHRLFLQNRNRKKEKFTSQFQELISSYLFSEDNGPYLKELKNVKHKFARQILIDQIIQLQTGLSGEVAVLLSKLYLELNLNKDSVKKLKSRKWNVRAQGIRELEKMNVSEGIDIIKRLLNSKNEIVRVEAHFAYLRISSSDSLSFLDNIRYPLTKWEQLRIYSIIKSNKIEVPLFSRWFLSPYPSVASFSMKLAMLLEQQETAPEIMDMLDSSNEEIQLQAIETIAQLYYLEASAKLRQIYLRGSIKVKIAVLKALAILQEENSFDFLVLVFQLEDNYNLCMRAAKTMVLFGEKGLKILQLSSSEKDSEKAAIRNHVIDVRI